jgi:hypothetical protein
MSRRQIEHFRSVMRDHDLHFFRPHRTSHSLNSQIIPVISLKDQKRRRKKNLVSFSKENLKEKREIAEQETELNE